MDDGEEGSAIMAASLLTHHANVTVTKKIIFTETWERERERAHCKGFEG